MTKCIKCEIEKDCSEFKSGSEKCFDCIKKYQFEYRQKNKAKSKEYQKNYYHKNREEILSQTKKYYNQNKDRVSEYKNEYWKLNKDILTQKNRDYYRNNKSKLDSKNNEYRNSNRKRLNQKRNLRLKELRPLLSLKNKERRKKDPVYRLSHNIRCYIRNSFKLKGIKKSTKTEKIIGCSFIEFKIHLESLFEPWMSWENYGFYNGQEKYGWDIDHIIPISSAKNEDDVIRLNHYTNLRPLCSFNNRHIKSSRLISDFCSQ